MDLFQNIWAITIIGGATATILATFIIRFFKVGKKPLQDQHQQVEVINNISINSNEGSQSLSRDSNVSDFAHLKQIGRILFIDDLDLKDKIQNLRNAGWANVSQVFHAKNIDQAEIRDAEVIFVDYKRIGLPAKDQGLAVLAALHKRYGEQKWLILYSAHPVPVNAFNQGARSYLAKNSSVYEVEQKILEGLKGLRQ